MHADEMKEQHSHTQKNAYRSLGGGGSGGGGEVKSQRVMLILVRAPMQHTGNKQTIED